MDDLSTKLPALEPALSEWERANFDTLMKAATFKPEDDKELVEEKFLKTITILLD